MVFLHQMNTLTKNRILQKGDEYFEPKKGKGWTAVPSENFGLQIQFTDYKEVRRPSEQPFPVTGNSPSNDSHPAPTARNVKTSEGVKRSPSAGTTPPSGVNPEQAAKCPASGRESISQQEAFQRLQEQRSAENRISPDNVATATAAPNVAKAESDESPVASHSATGDASYLPTIVSKKAHNLRETPETVNDARTEVAKSPVSPTPLTGDVDPATGSAPNHTQESDRAIIAKIPFDRPPTKAEQAALNREIERQPKLIPVKAAYDASNGLIKIKFPKPDPTNLIEMSEQPIWTGRNGTFTGYGLEAMRVNNNVMLSPIGKRGVGNCTIQMPLASIDELIEWLKKQTPK